VKAQNLRPTFSSKSADIGVGGGGGGSNPPKEKKTFAICQGLLRQYTPRTVTHVLLDNRLFYGQPDTDRPMANSIATNVFYGLFYTNVLYGLFDNTMTYSIL
jgi:hypothetical protein